MPKYKGEIERPKHQEIKLRDENGKSAGTIRVKPNSILYKVPKGRKWKCVTMEDLVAFIDENGRDVTR
jgi:hypothetical protein